MTKPDYSDIVKKNEAVAKHRRFITTKMEKLEDFCKKILFYFLLLKVGLR